MNGSTAPLSNSLSLHIPESPTDDSEAHAVLLSLAERKTRSVLAPLLTDHVLAVTRGADWPVRRAAMEAILRRSAFASRDALRVASRPAAGNVLGTYRTRRERSRHRPYVTFLESLRPLRGSCGCADFLRNSLGICKHLLVVLEGLAAQPERLRRAMSVERAAASGEAPRLIWDPIRPLTGAGDWLDRIRLVGRGTRRDVARWFQAGTNGDRSVASSHADDPQKRLRLVEHLLSLAAAGGARGEIQADPAIVALLGEERERLRVASGRLDGSALRTALRSLKRKLYPYQLEGVERAIGAARLLLADDMGSARRRKQLPSAMRCGGRGRSRAGW
jgi:hypothetical protein